MLEYEEVLAAETDAQIEAELDVPRDPAGFPVQALDGPIDALCQAYRADKARFEAKIETTRGQGKVFADVLTEIQTLRTAIDDIPGADDGVTEADMKRVLRNELGHEQGAILQGFANLHKLLDGVADKDKDFSMVVRGEFEKEGGVVSQVSQGFANLCDLPTTVGWVKTLLEDMQKAATIRADTATQALTAKTAEKKQLRDEQKKIIDALIALEQATALDPAKDSREKLEDIAGSIDTTLEKVVDTEALVERARDESAMGFAEVAAGRYETQQLISRGRAVLEAFHVKAETQLETAADNLADMKSAFLKIATAEELGMAMSKISTIETAMAGVAIGADLASFCSAIMAKMGVMATAEDLSVVQTSLADGILGKFNELSISQQAFAKDSELAKAISALEKVHNVCTTAASRLDTLATTAALNNLSTHIGTQLDAVATTQIPAADCFLLQAAVGALATTQRIDDLDTKIEGKVDVITRHLATTKTASQDLVTKLTTLETKFTALEDCSEVARRGAEDGRRCDSAPGTGYGPRGRSPRGEAEGT